MDINEIMKVETLPKIFQQLELLSKEIDKEVESALSLVCNEDSKQEVKKARANLNKIKTELEERRKSIKEQVMQPYLNFENVYNELIKDKLVYADNSLKSKIDEIETEQKKEKEQNIIDFFNEYADSLHIANIINWEQMNIKIGLSDSEKKLIEQVRSKLDSIANDIRLIDLEEYSNDIMVEYLKTYDFANSKLTVVNRIAEKQKLEEEKNKREQLQEQDKQIEQKVDNEITIPVEIVDNSVENSEPIYSVRFEVHGTKEKLVDLKKYMTDNEILFWSI